MRGATAPKNQDRLNQLLPDDSAGSLVQGHIYARANMGHGRSGNYFGAANFSKQDLYCAISWSEYWRLWNKLLEFYTV